MENETRLGSQTPSQSVVLHYETTLGNECIDLYEKTGRTAQEWQKLLVFDMLAINPDGLFTHTKFGYSVPRRNGKNEIVTMREIWGLVHGEHILHTAHRTTTSHAAYERLYDLLKRAGWAVDPDATQKITSITRALGMEHIRLETGGSIEFRTRTTKGGLGEGFDLLIIDEAQEYQDEQESALKYTVSDSPNPQTILTGTPPTPQSSGTVFRNFRNAVMMGETENAAWEEWGITEQTDVRDKEAWYIANPSLGTILTERKIIDEISGDPIDFNIQRLGLWIKYNQKSAISPQEWKELAVDKTPTFTGKMFVGIKYGLRGESVSLSVALRTGENRIFVECYDCRNIRDGDNWIVDFLSAARPAIGRIVIDGKSGQQILADELKGVKIKNPTLPTVNEVIAANAAFEKGLYNATIAHNSQPSVVQIVSNCEKRAIGGGGGFGYRSTIDDVDVTILDSLILAYWACSEGKTEHTRQQLNY